MYTGTQFDIFSIDIFVLKKWETLILSWTVNCSTFVTQIHGAKPVLYLFIFKELNPLLLCHPHVLMAEPWI